MTLGCKVVPDARQMTKNRSCLGVVQRFPELKRFRDAA